MFLYQNMECVILQILQEDNPLIFTWFIPGWFNRKKWLIKANIFVLYGHKSKIAF